MSGIRGSISGIRGNSTDSNESDSRFDDESRADNLKHDCDDELERIIGGDLIWNRSSGHGDEYPRGGHVYVVDELPNKRPNRWADVPMECGRDKLVGNFRLYNAAVFYDAIRARHSAHPDKSNTRFDDESGAHDLEHDRDDELERIIGGDLIRNRSS